LVRSFVEFAVAHPELFRVMSGECGAECRKAEPGGDATEDPWSLLGKSLDALIADGPLASELRPGAELEAWSVVHGVCVSRARRAGLDARRSRPRACAGSAPRVHGGWAVQRSLAGCVACSSTRRPRAPV